MAQSILWKSRWKRLLVSASSGFLLWGPPVIAVIVGAVLSVIFSQGSHAGTMSAASSSWFRSLWAWAIVGALVSIVLLVLQTYFEFQRRTYDPTWILKFGDVFDGPLKPLRAKAARVLKEHLGKLRRLDDDLADIDEILDLFEDVGFYVHGDQISPEVAHHSFYYWLKGYYVLSREYLEVWAEKEPARWLYVDELFETTHKIEVRKSGDKATRNLTEAKVAKFLKEEMEADD